MKPQMALVALLAIGLLSARPVVSQAPVKLNVTHEVPLVDEVYLNGNGPFRFILDTGSQSNLIDPKVARRIGLNPTVRFVLSTPSGDSTVPAAWVDVVAAGSMQASHQKFLVARLGDARSHGAVGILGQEFLQNFDYFMDLRHGRLMAADPPSNGQRIPVRMVHGSMAIPTNFGDLILDSGADTVLLFRMSSLFSSANWIETAGGSARRVFTEADQILEIGHRLYHLRTINFDPLPGREESGLLPTTLFHSIYVSNSGHYLILDPR